MKPHLLLTLTSLPIWRIAICALLFASAGPSALAREKNPPAAAKPGGAAKSSGAIFANGPADGGRLVIRRSPVLGTNVSINVQIDGKQAGSLMRGSYEKFITPGAHTITVSANHSDDGQATLIVEPGKTYSYSLSYKVYKLVLTPTGPR